MALPYVSIEGIPDSRLALFGYENLGEDSEFVFYLDLEGRVSIAHKNNPYIWVEDMGDAIQMGSKSIIVTGPSPTGSA